MWQVSIEREQEREQSRCSQKYEVKLTLLLIYVTMCILRATNVPPPFVRRVLINKGVCVCLLTALLLVYVCICILTPSNRPPLSVRW
jgi:hypothetical protein